MTSSVEFMFRDYIGFNKTNVNIICNYTYIMLKEINCENNLNFKSCGINLFTLEINLFDWLELA